MRPSRFSALACLLLLVVYGRAHNSDVLAATERGDPVPRSPELISIRTAVNDLIITVRADGTLAPASAIVGAAEQFELHDLGRGFIALRAVATGRFVTADNLGPLRADAEEIGAAQRFRTRGESEGLVRLRSRAAQAFVCAAQRGRGVIAVARRCPRRSELFAFEPIRVAPPRFAISEPQPGATLTSTAVTFKWEAGGQENWLEIGSVPGASDVYASQPLGSAHEHTVSGLPLNAQTLHVHVRRRVGAVVETADAEYIAAIRRGVALITDFADRRLEDWSGPGFRTVDDLRAQLAEMERYWAWLSRDLEKFQWDVIRVQLPEAAVPEAYESWGAFRDAVVARARQQIRVIDYDVDRDGEIDAAWLVVSMGFDSLPYVIGGTSSNGGACVFVDGQASGSVQAGATGNFTHELGHCLGLPDMYGSFTTLNKLTVMNDSWALPPQDFSAYERVALGWIDPQIVDESTRGVWLPSADQSLAAVMVPTVRPNEYFLIEYRNPPATGYGSATQGYKGLAVYHVLIGSSMWQDPPLVKLEPADGVIGPSEEFDPNDFLYPNSSTRTPPMVMRSYYGEREEVLRIENVAVRDGGLVFDVVLLPQAAPVNLLHNGSFEVGRPGMPEAWAPGAHSVTDATFVWPEPEASDESSSASLASTFGNDVRWFQPAVVTPGAHYQLCGSMKGQSVLGVTGDVGANVSVMGTWVRSEGLSGTFDWKRACVDFTAEAAGIEVACRLGFYASVAAGKVWCDDLTLEHIRLGSAFER